ncbi:hypothetical protein NUV66_10375 [Pseudomonas sp. 32.2.56]|uniref:hypothetical protein n=1 Tax=Pseudomonas sp. 32.2.56 TaxID=2969303 RepID=UPI00214F78AA|nr:hypothetical protein [Pseudomonas sp. 32.2.56]MCR4509714.1 hypothetical protein [Pseudomonas sp. 32.2.56]
MPFGIDLLVFPSLFKQLLSLLVGQNKKARHKIDYEQKIDLTSGQLPSLAQDIFVS